MIPILDKQLQKEYKLLSILDSDDKWWVSTEISECTGTSAGTVQKCIHNLAEHLKHWNKKDISVEIYSNNGIHLLKRNDFNIHEVYFLFAKKSLAFQFLNSVFFEKSQTVVGFCMNHYCSKSSLYRRLSPMRNFLAEFNLELDISSFKIMGSEVQIRYFYYTFFWNIYRGCEWPFKSIKHDKIINWIEKLCDYLKCCISETEKEQYAYWIAINMTRIKNGCILKENGMFNFIIEKNGMYERVRELFDDPLYNVAFPFETEKQFNYVILYAFPYFETIHTKLFDEAANKGGERFYPYDAAKISIEIFKKHFRGKKIFENNKSFLRFIRFYCHTGLFSGTADLQENFSFLLNMQSTYPVFYKKLTEVCEELLKTGVKKYFEDKTYIFPRYALLCSQLFNLAKLEKPIYIKIVTDQGSIYEEKIKGEIKRKYDTQFNIKFIPKEKATADIVVTNIPNMKNQKENLLNIHDELSDRDWNALYSMLKEIRNNKSQ